MVFAPQVQGFFEGGTYLKFGRRNESFLLQILKKASFDCRYSSLSKERSGASCLGKARGLHNIYRATYFKNFG